MSSNIRPPEHETVKEEIGQRWNDACRLVEGSNKGGGTSLRLDARIFLKSLFDPKSLPSADTLPVDDERRLVVQRLRGFSPYGSLKPSESSLKDAENQIIAGFLELTPPLAPKAMETIDALADSSHLTIWTVGDYAKISHDLPPGFVPEGEKIRATGHQVWKLWKAGLTERPDINIAVSDNKLGEVISKVKEQEEKGVQRFIFADDSFKNLADVRIQLEAENLRRIDQGQTPVKFDLILINQGRKRTIPPPQLEIGDSNGSYSVLDNFYDTPSVIEKMVAEDGQKPGL